VEFPGRQNDAVPAVESAMPDDITISATAAVQHRQSSVHSTSATAVEPQTGANPAPVSPPVFNPTLRLDPALGLVVVEYRNDRGVITTSIPPQRMLEAYQHWENTHLGPAPPSGTGFVATGPSPAKSDAPNSTETVPDKSGNG
jgi:hypothetical protein